MDTLTTVVFLLDVLETKPELKRKLHKKQIEKLENLIKTLYRKINTNINHDEYLALYNIHRSKLNSEKNHDRKLYIIETINRIKYLLTTGEELESTQVDSTDEVIITLNKAYEFISQALKESITEIINTPVTERDIQNFKSDMSENASIEIIRLYLKSGKTKEQFCEMTFISLFRLNKAIEFILSTNDEKLAELQEKVLEKEEERESEIALIEQVMLNYNRKIKNISLIEFQSLSSQSINHTLAILKERKSIAYPYLNELYKEYQNRLRLTPFSFKSIREMKTIINGKPMTDEDHDTIEQFFKENNYPNQRAIYTYVREAYLKGDLESVRRDNLKRTVLDRFGLTEKPKEKIHK